MRKVKPVGFVDKMLLGFIVIMFAVAFCIKPAKADFLMGYMFGSMMSDDCGKATDNVWFKVDEKILYAIHNHQDALKVTIRANDDVMQNMIAHYAMIGIIFTKTSNDNYDINLKGLSQ